MSASEPSESSEVFHFAHCFELDAQCCLLIPLFRRKKTAQWKNHPGGLEPTNRNYK
jgi:hypothetical protein